LYQFSRDMQHLDNQSKNARSECEEYKKESLQYKKKIEQLQAQEGSDRQFKLTIEKILNIPDNWNYYDVLGISTNTPPGDIASIFTKVKSPL
jgi:hypothetical protein